MSDRPIQELPPYAYVPGGPWPHPNRSNQEHSSRTEPTEPIVVDRWDESSLYMHGFELFNQGYYWEAHEAWEALWHAHGRSGAIAWILQALIKLAAAGVKVREGRPAGVRTHAARAAALLDLAIVVGGTLQIGLNLELIAKLARNVEREPQLIRYQRARLFPGSSGFRSIQSLPPAARMFEFRKFLHAIDQAMRPCAESTLGAGWWSFLSHLDKLVEPPMV